MAVLTYWTRKHELDDFDSASLPDYHPSLEDKVESIRQAVEASGSTIEHSLRRLARAISEQTEAIKRHNELVEEQTEMQKACLLVLNQNMLINYRQMNELKSVLIAASSSEPESDL